MTGLEPSQSHRSVRTLVSDVEYHWSASADRGVGRYSESRVALSPVLAELRQDAVSALGVGEGDLHAMRTVAG